MELLQMLSNGLAMLAKYWVALLVFLLTTFGLGLFVVRGLKLDRFQAGPGQLACLPLGSLVLVIYAYLLALLGYRWPFLLRPGGFLLVLLAILALARYAWERRKGFRPNPLSIVVLAGLFLLLLVRLSFLAHLLVPPYSDSPLHYQAVVDMLGQGNGANIKISLGNIQNYYYHFGFHAATAWLVTVSGLPPLEAIALMGQLFLWIGPLAIFALALCLTGSVPGALLAGLLAGVGWSMPAFAANWGKYPALAALSCAPAALAGLSAWPRRGLDLLRAIWLLALFLATVLLHTRIIFILGLATVVFILVQKLVPENKPGIYQVLLRSLALGLFLWAFLTFFGEAYAVLPIWLFLLALTPFGAWHSPRLLLITLLFIAGIWLQTFLPLPRGQTLLDRPFIEILLAAPLSLWAGIGFAGLLDWLGGKRQAKAALCLAAVSLILAVFLSRGAYLPDPCCNYFTHQDEQAFGWIRRNATSHTLFIIAVFADEKQRFGADAGIWIESLTGAASNMFAYDTDWDDPASLALLCHAGAGETYLYAGGRDFSFPSAVLTRQAWLQPVFRAGQVQIYQVTGCSQP